MDGGGCFNWISISNGVYQFQIGGLNAGSGTSTIRQAIYFRIIATGWAGPWYKVTGEYVESTELSNFI